MAFGDGVATTRVGVATLFFCALVLGETFACLARVVLTCLGLGATGVSTCLPLPRFDLVSVFSGEATFLFAFGGALVLFAVFFGGVAFAGETIRTLFFATGDFAATSVVLRPLVALFGFSGLF